MVLTWFVERGGSERGESTRAEGGVFVPATFATCLPPVTASLYLIPDHC